MQYFIVSPALEGRGKRKRGGQDWGLKICSLSAGLHPLAGTKDTDIQTQVMNLSAAFAFYHEVLMPNGSCPPGLPPRLASQGSSMATEGTSVRAEGAVDLPNMQGRQAQRWTQPLLQPEQGPAHFSRDKAPGALGKPHPLAD